MSAPHHCPPGCQYESVSKVPLLFLNFTDLGAQTLEMMMKRLEELAIENDRLKVELSHSSDVSSLINLMIVILTISLSV